MLRWVYYRRGRSGFEGGMTPKVAGVALVDQEDTG